MPITAAQFQSVMQLLSADGGQVSDYVTLAAGANDAIARASVPANNYGAAAFLANLTQESMYFKTSREGRWPGYDADLSAKPYYPYVGRGFVQVTWQTNYAAFGAWCVAKGIAGVGYGNYFVDNIVALEDVRFAWLTGTWYFSKDYAGAGWDADGGLWTAGNNQNFLGVCNGVNRGNVNYSGYPAGWTERQDAYTAWLTLGDDLAGSGGVGPVGGPDPAYVTRQGSMLGLHYVDGTVRFVRPASGSWWSV